MGWISDDDVDLTGPCAAPESVPERIQFAPGETSITLEGMLEPPQRDFYLFRASAGQQTTQDYLLTVAAPAEAATTGYRIFLTIEPLAAP